MPSMIPLSVLDLSPIIEGGDASRAFANTLDLARHVEAWGFNRFWLAEHHNMTGIASAATAVVIGHVAGGTSTIRVGSGGIMLPNHAPLVIAEQFGTLEALYPGRIELGLGLAPTSAPPRHSVARCKATPMISPAMYWSCSIISVPFNPTNSCRRCRAPASMCRFGYSAQVCSAPSSPPCSACPMPSPRISRPLR